MTSPWCHTAFVTKIHRITLRVPGDIAKKLLRDVNARKKTERKLSTNDWIVEAIEAKLEYGRTARP